MKNNLLKTFCLLFIAFPGINARAQSTYADVYTILHTNCSSQSCHGSGASNASFNVDTSAAVLYAQLINGNPTNPYARDSVNNKLVVPGSPQTSFMMRKLAHCTGNALKMKVPNEGDTMPRNAPKLATVELELILQWIWQGASQTAAIVPDTVAGSICDLPLSVRTLKPEQVAFSLSPNPVVNNFSLSYTLESAATVSLDIFGADGKIVKPLINEGQSSGKHVFSFSISLRQGVYFVRLKAGSRPVVPEVGEDVILEISNSKLQIPNSLHLT